MIRMCSNTSTVGERSTRRRSRHDRLRSGYTLLQILAISLAVVLAACDRTAEAAAGDDPPLESPRPLDDGKTLVPLDSLLELVVHTPLHFPADDLLGEGWSVAWDDGFWVADETARKVKQFRPDGTFVRAFGRPGDGPGEFRLPDRVAVLPGGRLAVHDGIRSAVSILGPDGKHMYEWSTHFRALGAFLPLPDGTILFTGPVQGQSGSRAGVRALVHFADDRGRVRRSLPLPGSELNGLARWLMNVDAMLVDRNTLAIIASTRPELVLHDLRTGQRRRFSVGSPLYRAPQFPAKKPEAIQDALAWANQQSWLTQVFPGGSGTVIVGISRPIEDSTPRFHYVLMDTAGRRMAVSEETDLFLSKCGGESICSLRVAEDSVDAFVFRPRPVSPISGTRR